MATLIAMITGSAASSHLGGMALGTVWKWWNSDDRKKARAEKKYAKAREERLKWLDEATGETEA